MKTNRILSVVLGAGLIFFAGLMAFLTVPTSVGEAKSKDLVGSWNIEITVNQQGAVFPGLVTFFDDGNVLTDEVPSPLETSGHGSWVSTGKDEAMYTFIFLMGIPDAADWLKGTVSGTVEYDPQVDQWNGPFTITLVDQDGNTALDDTGTMTGTRISAAP
jgi:hypothetical protein